MSNPPDAAAMEIGAEPASQAQPRSLLARRALAGAAGLGILADPLLRNGFWGLGMAVWIGACAVLLLALLRWQRRKLPLEGKVWLVTAVIFAGGMAWRDSDLLLAFDMLAVLASLVLLAMSLNRLHAPGVALARIRDLILGALRTGLDTATGAVPLSLIDAKLGAGLVPSSGALRVTRAVALTAPIVLLFTVLLAEADPVFGSLFRFPELELDELLSHVIVAGFFGWVVAGWLRGALLPRSAADEEPDEALPFSLEATDLKVSLGALNLLFLAFVLVQASWLFGGEELVLRTTGLSYAEYARRGFFELTLVAGLLLPLLLVANALIPETDARARRVYRLLAVPLVLLLGAIMASAFARMGLYVRYYGISTDRLYATAVMIWLAIVFAWLAVTVLRGRPGTFALGFVTSAFGVLLCLNVLNPDAFVARSNLARRTTAEAGTAGADLSYLATLGGDAVPMLVDELVAGEHPGNDAEAASRCGAAYTLLTRWTGENRADMTRSWGQWNAARAAALTAVGTRQAQLEAMTCPVTPGTI